MMNIYKIAACFLMIWTLAPGLARAQLNDLALNPLRIEIGSRPLGMGGAFSGLADDMNSAIYNPGGLAWAKGISLTVKDLENVTAVQAYPTGFGSSVGLAVVTSKISNIPIPAGTANSNSNVISLSYGTKLLFLPGFYQNPNINRLGVGISIKGLMGQTLRRSGELDRSASGFDVDIGMLWKGGDWWQAGVVAQNILPMNTLGGGAIKWDVGGEESIPATGKLAASGRVIGDIGSPVFMEGRELILSGELNIHRTRPLLMRLGGELGFNKTYYVRSGFMQQHAPVGIASNINYGLGYRKDRWGLDMASYHEPASDQRVFYASFVYFPKEWIVLRKLDVERPAVMLEDPFETISLEDNIITYDDKIEVFGKVKPGVEVYINGLRASLDKENSFKVTVPLRLGKNLIIVEARYEGEKKVWKYKVLRKAKVKIKDEEKVADLKDKKAAVESLVTMGVIEITPEAEFVMEAGVTRGELSSWLVKSAELKLPEVTRDLFTDVPRDHPLAPYIKVVTEMKLIMPFPDGTFRPGAVVSKEEGDAIFARFGGIK